MVANILVTDDKRVAIEKTISGAYDIAVCVSVPGMMLLYALSAEVLHVLSVKGHFSFFGKVAGVSLFTGGSSENQVLDRLERIFGSVMTEYDLLYEADDDDDRDVFTIGMI